MSQGIEVFNAAGIKIIDAISPCLVLAQKTPITAWTGFTGDLQSVQTATVTYTGQADSTPVPVIYLDPAVHGSSCVAGVFSMSRSGNTWTYVLAVAYPQFASPPNPNGSVFFLIYDRPRSSSSGASQGFEVYDVNGKPTFTGAVSPTNGAFLKPVGLGGTSLPAGRKYGALASFFRVQNTYDGDLNTDQTFSLSVREDCTAVNISSTGVSLLEILSSSFFSPNAGGGGNGVSNYGIIQEPIAVDLTGTV